jgi:hypothetical protein
MGPQPDIDLDALLPERPTREVLPADEPDAAGASDGPIKTDQPT